jgi:hypothetical protein
MTNNPAMTFTPTAKFISGRTPPVLKFESVEPAAGVIPKRRPDPARKFPKKTKLKTIPRSATPIKAIAPKLSNVASRFYFILENTHGDPYATRSRAHPEATTAPP